MTDLSPIARAAHLAINANARPGDQLTLYKVVGGETQHAHYTCDTHNMFQLQPMPSAYYATRGDERAWRSIKWPDTLMSADLERLGRGWCLRGGYAVSKRAALEYDARRAQDRLVDLESEVAGLRVYVARCRELGVL